MFKIICVLFFCVCYYGSGAQNPVPKPLNLTASYSVGLQTFGLNGLENTINSLLIRNMPSAGNIENANFPTTIVNRISVGASIFKNKKWFLHLDGIWGSNSITTHGYSTDANGNPYVATAKANFSFIYTGQLVSREFDLGKWGKISPYVGFYLYWKTVFKLRIDYEIKDETTNEIVKSGRGIGASQNPYRRGSPFLLWLFDNPKLGLNYSLKLLNHTYLNLNYSYWFGNVYANEAYGLSNNYILKTTNRSLTKEDRFHKDLYSHNLSVGLTFKLAK